MTANNTFEADEDGSGQPGSILFATNEDKLPLGSPWRGIVYASRQGAWGHHVIFCGLGSLWIHPAFRKKVNYILGLDGHSDADVIFLKENSDKECIIFVDGSDLKLAENAVYALKLLNKSVLVILDGEHDLWKTALVFAGIIDFPKVDPFNIDAVIDAINESLIAENNHVIMMTNMQRDKVNIYPCIVNRDICTGCARCVRRMECPALSMYEGRASIDVAICNGCTLCLQVCPWTAIVQNQPLL